MQLSRVLAGVLATVAVCVYGQAPDSPNTDRSFIETHKREYRSPFAGYRAYRTAEPISWPEANDTVAKAGDVAGKPTDTKPTVARQSSDQPSGESPQRPAPAAPRHSGHH